MLPRPVGCVETGFRCPKLLHVIRHFTASGIVLSGDGRVLLIEHRKLGKWLYPGGHVDPDEDPVQAVLREVEEETGVRAEVISAAGFSYPGLTVVPLPFTICVQDIPAREDEPAHQHIDMVYVLRPGQDGRMTAPRSEEVTGCAWVPLGKVADLEVPAELPALINAAAVYAQAHAR
jgi:8-oxo-dGTP diphosphatase